MRHLLALELKANLVILRSRMNTTSRAILQTVLNTDGSLADPERRTIQRLIDGTLNSGPSVRPGDERLLVTQKVAAHLLSVDRVTVWRMTKDGMLHPVEILPGTWRYLWAELLDFAKTGWRRQPEQDRTAAA